MSVAFYQVALSVRPKGGEAEFVLPPALHDLNQQFVVIKEGGAEGIVRVEASAEALARVDQDNQCTKLTVDQVELLKKSYPSPKLKRKYRSHPAMMAAREGEPTSVLPTVDAANRRTVETLQTVRSGFYLIDVPVIE